MKKLPVNGRETAILSALRNNQVIIVEAETGSGKTTQIPQMLYRAGFGKVVVTQPRKIAATSVAEFVAAELNVRLGAEVGYQVRFDANVDNRTLVTFMTEGILLKKVQEDSTLSRCSVVMLDEAHERSLNMDVLLGLLKEALKQRSDLRVVIASATIDTERFSRYFGNAPVITVEGKMFPVDVHYGGPCFGIEQSIEAAVCQVIHIHKNGSAGDILVFMPGEEEINKTIVALEDGKYRDMVILPAHGGLAPEELGKMFRSFPGKRKVIVATNIAETSVTIDGIVYVVDTGLVRQMRFHPESGLRSLDTVLHSRAGCDQRKGRAGRTRPGTCFRLYTEADYRQRLQFTEPEIRRESIAGVILMMENMGIRNIERFDFIEPLEPTAFHEGYQTLVALGAIDKNGVITRIGKKMVELPLDPCTARMVLEAQKFGCVGEVAVIAAFLSTKQVFVRPRGEEVLADMEHAKFKDATSDALMYLKVWRGYLESNGSGRWAHKNFLNAKALREVGNIHNQLLNILQRSKVVLSEGADDESIVKCVVSGLMYNLYEHSSRGEYRAVCRAVSHGPYIHPSSGIGEFRATPRWVVAGETVRTKKEYMRFCSVVKPEWLVEFLPQKFSWGILTLSSVDYLGGKARARQELLFDGKPTSLSAEREVGIDEAEEIQNKAIGEAERLGYKRLTFGEADRMGRFRILENCLYTTMSFEVGETGGVYYCKLTQFSGGSYYARPVFRVFKFAKKEKAPEAKSEAPSDQAALESLLTWAAHRNLGTR